MLNKALKRNLFFTELKEKAKGKNTVLSNSFQV